MGSSRSSLRRSLLLSILFALCLFSAVAMAQRDQTTADDNDNGNTRGGGNGNGRTTSNNGNRQTRTTETPKQSEATPTKQSTQEAPSTTATSQESLPPISTSTSVDAGNTNFPTLTRAPGNQEIPTYPPPSPPPVKDAPFMNRSTMPDGTVFIAVGAILGAFGAAVLIWRGVVACLLHRSVERAAMAQHVANDKATFAAPPAPFYKYADRDRDSSPSLPAGATPGRGQRRTQRGPTPSATPSQTNLFFSPTASAGVGGMGGSGNRDSRYLPSGFYAATSASPIPQSHSHGNSISLSNLRPASRGHAGVSPPDSPSLGPRGTPTPRNFSTSSFNLNHPPSERAPSAYLDDLLDEQPGAFPPAGNSHNRNFSQSTQGRY